MAPVRPERTVWVVDDSALDARRAQQILEPDYHVEIFDDGSSVLERLIEGRAPDVLVFDWLMPAVSGLEVCRFLRSPRSPAPHVAILIQTVHNEPEQVATALATGANDYLTKPYSDLELRARVGNLARTAELIERLTRAEQQVRRLLAAAPDALLSADERGVITFVNQEAERVLGRSAERLVGSRLADLLPDIDLSPLLSRDGPEVLPLPDIRIGHEQFSPAARRMPPDISAHVSIALRNVTERRRAEARRLDFYSVIAHDLRSPLHSMLLRTDMLLSGQRGQLPVGAIADLRKIQSNIRTMVALVNDFLDLAQLEGTDYVVQRELVDLRAVVEQCLEDLQPLVQESQLDARLLADDHDLSDMADRRRLQQVIINLLSNAIKFTPTGGMVAVRIRSVGDHAEVSVQDTGRGIAPELLPQLFQRYARAIDPAHQVCGTGLGLMIVREVVEAHGGTVGVRSKPGEGSTFWFRIPRLRAERQEPAAQVEAEAEARAERPVLIVDDDREMRETLRFLLEAQGYRAVEAENGEQGLEALHLHSPCAVFSST